MLSSFDQLQGHPVLGYSWEGFAIEQIISSMPFGWEAFFYRTASGVEIDLILMKQGKNPIAVEIKYSSAPKLEKGFHIAYGDLKCKKGFVVYPGRDMYPLKKDIFTLPFDKVNKIFE